MSTWTIIVIAIIALLCLNSAVIVYLKRKGRIPNDPIARKAMPAANVAIGLVIIGFFVAGYAAPKLMPDSAIARLIGEVGYFVYFGTCLIIAVIIQIVLGLVARHRSASNRAV